MGASTLSEKLGIAAIVLAAGCASDHHVSPWGGRTGPSFAAFLPRPDLAGRLAAVDAEAAALGLSPGAEIRVELPQKAGPAVIRGYEGRDVAGRPVHAVRVATALGVVMAVGPLDAGGVDRRQATELVPALQQGGAYRTGTDLAGDGRLAVVLRDEAGALAVWHFDAYGASAYPIVMEAPPSRGVDIDSDGRVDFAGELPIASDDPIAPHLGDVATYASGRYWNATIPARAWHTRLTLAPPVKAPDEARLRAAIEHAWHAILGGQAAESVLRDLRRQPVPAALRAAFERHASLLGDLPSHR